MILSLEKYTKTLFIMKWKEESGQDNLKSTKSITKEEEAETNSTANKREKKVTGKGNFEE